MSYRFILTYVKYPSIWLNRITIDEVRAICLVAIAMKEFNILNGQILPEEDVYIQFRNITIELITDQEQYWFRKITFVRATGPTIYMDTENISEKEKQPGDGPNQADDDERGYSFFTVEIIVPAPWLMGSFTEQKIRAFCLISIAVKQYSFLTQCYENDSIVVQFQGIEAKLIIDQGMYFFRRIERSIY